jgi:hypothetical protein
MSTSTENTSPPRLGQEILDKILSELPKVPLYHYTTQEGLLGIIRNREIWATHHQCLNDIREFVHAKEMLREELANGARANPLLEGMHRRLTGEGLESVNLYVASFSEDPDSLAQWRAYGGPMSSFCLGFDTSGMSLASPFVIVRCIYEEERQRAIIRNLVGEILERLQKLPREITRTPRFAEPYINLLPRLALHRLALILKHPKFAEEKEWRIISSSPMMETAPNEGEVPLDFREGKSILVPYRRLPLRNNVNDFPLAEFES